MASHGCPWLPMTAHIQAKDKNSSALYEALAGIDKACGLTRKRKPRWLARSAPTKMTTGIRAPTRHDWHALVPHVAGCTHATFPWLAPSAPTKVHCQAMQCNAYRGGWQHEFGTRGHRL